MSKAEGTVSLSDAAGVLFEKRAVRLRKQEGIRLQMARVGDSYRIDVFSRISHGKRERVTGSVGLTSKDALNGILIVRPTLQRPIFDYVKNRRN